MIMSLFGNMPYTDKDQAKADELLGDDYLSHKLFVISPAASKAQRNWLADRYAALADYATYAGV